MSTADHSFETAVVASLRLRVERLMALSIAGGLIEASAHTERNNFDDRALKCK